MDEMGLVYYMFCLLQILLFVSVGRATGPHDDEDIGPSAASGSGVDYTSGPDDKTSLPYTQTPPSYESPGPARKIYIGVGVAVLSVVTVTICTVIVIKLLKRRRTEEQAIQMQHQPTHKELKETSSNVYTYINPALQPPLKQYHGEGGYLTPVHRGYEKPSNIYINTGVKTKM